MTRRVHSRSKAWRRVFHGTVVGRKAFLRIRPRRFYCGSCKKAFTETFPGIEKWSRRTIQRKRRSSPTWWGPAFTRRPSVTGWETEGSGGC
ncbi:MAG: hypothetical protein KM310_02855 [Clostridiales bacterium]|nr:hypothetical protein [Clostridiales bacterium]